MSFPAARAPGGRVRTSTKTHASSSITILFAASTSLNPNPGHMPVVTLGLWLRPRPRHVRIRRREAPRGRERPPQARQFRWLPPNWLAHGRRGLGCRWLLPPLVRAAQARCWSLLALASGARLRTTQSRTTAFSHTDTTGRMTTTTASSGLLTRASVTSGAANDPDTRGQPRRLLHAPHGCYTARSPLTTVLCQTHLMTGLPWPLALVCGLCPDLRWQ